MAHETVIRSSLLVRDVQNPNTATQKFAVFTGSGNNDLNLLGFRTPTELLSDIGFNEAVDDRVSTLIQAGANISVTYDDDGNALIIAAPNTVTGSGTATQIAFWDGTTGSTSTSLSGSSNLYWDNVNGRLGVGTANPSARFHVRSTGTTSSTTALLVQNGAATPANLLTVLDNGQVGIRNASPSADLHVSTGQGGSLFIGGGSAGHEFRINTFSFTNDVIGTAGRLYFAHSNNPIMSFPQGGASGIIIYPTSTTQTTLSGVLISTGRTITNGNIFSVETNRGITGAGVTSSAFNFVGARNLDPTNNIIGSVYNDLYFGGIFSPSTATNNISYNGIQFEPTIDQRNGTNAPVRGILINPTITSSPNFRSVEWTNISGFGLYGSGTAPNYINGNLLLGNLLNNARLQVHGADTTDTGWTAQFHNSLGNSNSLMIRNDGNVGIGTSGTTARLVVRGSGSSAASNALIVQNSGGTSSFVVQDDGIVRFNTARVISGFMTLQTNGGSNLTGFSFTSVNPFTATSDITSYISGNPRYWPVSGTGTFTYLNVNPSIDQTGGANGITRGIYIQPSLISAPNWRSIEWNNDSGFGLYGAGTATNYLNGNLGIKTTTPAQTLHVAGTMRLTGNAGTATEALGRDANGDLSGVPFSTIVASGGGVSGSGTATQVAFWGGTTGSTSTSLSGSSNLYWDNVNGRLGVGTNSPSTQLEIKSALNTGAGITGSELLASSGWTTTGWTGDFFIGFTHSTGNTTPLSNSFSPTIDEYYHISITTTGNTTGNYTLSFGGFSPLDPISATGTTNFGLKATTTDSLTITPTSTYNGTLLISIKVASASTATQSWKNSSGLIVNELRAGNSPTNTFLGLNSATRLLSGTSNVGLGNETFYNSINPNNSVAVGYQSLSSSDAEGNVAVGYQTLRDNTKGHSNTAIGRASFRATTSGYGNVGVGAYTGVLNTTGFFNVGIGYFAFQANTTGYYNVAIGNRALRSNTVGFSNLAVGQNALFLNTSGSSNTAFGTAALYRNTTGTNNIGIGNNSLDNNDSGGFNIAIGQSAGSLVSAGTANTLLTNSILIGRNTRVAATGQTNQVVIGDQAIGLGSNTTVIGNTGTTQTHLHGNLTLGSTSSPAARMVVTGADDTNTGWTAQFHNSLGNSNSLMIRNDGNVGIGTTGTTARLVVRASGSSTGSTAMLVENSGGTAMLTVREDGNVGVGLNNPAYKLDVLGRAIRLGESLTPSGTRTNNTDKIGELIAPSYSGSKDVIIYQTYNSLTSNSFRFGGGTSIYDSPTEIRFFTATAVNTVGVERMRITSSGTVGIGNITPVQTLDVAGTMRLTGSTGTGTTLMARNADGDVSAVTVGSGLNLSNNTLTATGGGTGTATQIAFWDGTTGTTSSSLASSANLYWDNVNSRLGVGTNVPLVSLDISGNLRTTGGYQAISDGAKSFFVDRYSTNSFSDEFAFRKGRGTSASPLAVILDDEMGGVEFHGYHGSGTSAGSMIRGYVDGTYTSPSMSGRLSFFTNNGTQTGYGGERMRINSVGNVGVGTTSPNARLQVQGSDTSDTGWTAQFHNSLGNSNSLMIRNDGNVGIGTTGTTARLVVRGSGTTSATEIIRAINGDNQSVLRVYDNGAVRVGRIGESPTWFPQSNLGTPDLAGTNLVFINGTTGQSASFGKYLFRGEASTQTSGDNYCFYISEQFSPPSGNATSTAFYVRSIINQTNGGTGITRGLSAIPSLAGAVQYQTIHWNTPRGTNNWGLYGEGTALNYLQSALAIGTTTQNASSILELSSTTRGFLPPRMTSVERDAIATPAAGLQVYNTTLNVMQHYNGTTWVSEIGGSGGTGTVSGSGTATQVAFWKSGSTTELTSSSNLYWDNVNSRLGVGITTPTSNLDVVGSVEFQNPTTDYDGGILGSELLTTGTGTNWTGSGFATGYLHVTGSTVALVSSASISSGQFYQVVVTVSGRTTGSITFSIGGYTSSSISTNTTTTVGPKTTSTDAFTVTPTTDFNGTVSASVKVITAGSVSFVCKNSAGTTVYEERISSFNSNIFQGINAGRLNTTGIQNVFQGVNAGSSNTTGISNFFQGANAGLSNTTGSNNIFQGRDAGLNNTTGFNNIFQGVSAGVNNTTGHSNFFQGTNAGALNTTGIYNVFQGVNAGLSNTTGSNNTLIGYQAGRYVAGGLTGNTLITDSILIGFDTRALASGQTNQVVVGYNGRGLGSNTTVIGNTSTVQTHLHGSLTLGSTNVPTARMVVVGSGSSDTGWTAQFHNVLGNSNSLMIRDDGNVGIGTSAPSARLQINAFGTGSTASAFLIQNSASTSVFSVRDNGDIYGTNTLTLSATKPSINIVGSGISNLDSWGINFNYGVSNKFVILYSEYDKQIFFKGASSNASLILNQDNSNVGINIPAGSLVRSQFVVAGNSYIASGDGIANARLHVLGSGTTNTGWTAQFHNSGGTNNSLMIRNDGNVGIGTDAPAQTLHVAGTMRLTGSTGTGTTLMARNAAGDVSAVTLGTGVVLSNNVISVALSPKAETPSGLVNGSNITYTLASTPIANQSVMVFLNGVAQYNGIDYTVSGTTITFGTAPANGSSIFAYYMA